MIQFMTSYITYFENNWIMLLILWVLLIILARTKMNMHWLDIIIPGLAFILWAIFELVIYFTCCLK